MLAGLGIKSGDTRFKLPDIKSSDGKGAYVPSAPKEKTKAKAAAERAAILAGGGGDENEMDTSSGLILSMAAAIVSANHEPGLLQSRLKTAMVLT